ncbi:hypothetical protein [Flavobacterium chungangense]|uniref:hypothetical protein n=1 Tax=Flavobacterium chungangense TaxID=554283 RepID=UPI0006EB9082|nr:hypothetical protein [Flavobacterium chungangense]
MKLLLMINKIALFTTLTLLIIIYFGLLAQIVLGIIQVISAICLTIKMYYKSDYAKRHLSNYWIVTIAELGLCYLQYYHFQTSNDAIVWSVILIFPISIAIYFYIIMKKIVEEYEYIKKHKIKLNLPN